MIKTIGVDLEKSILLAIPTATGSQSAVVRFFCNNIRATVTKTHRRILWLCGPRGCGKHFLFSACYKGVKGAGMLAAYIDGTKANGETKSYYTLFQELDQQILDQITIDLPAEFNPKGRAAETELQVIFSGLIRLCSPDIVNIFVTIPDTNVADAVRFVTDIKSLAQEHNNVVISGLMGDNSEAKDALEATQFQNDPREEMLQLGLPSIQEYKNLSRTFADAFDRALTDETAGLCAAQATKLHAPPSYLRKLIAEASTYTDFEITAEHITIALQALDLKPLEPLKDPVTAVPILQAYASLYLAEKTAKKLKDRDPFFVSISALLSTYRGLAQSLDIPTLTPTDFEAQINNLKERDVVSINDSSLSLNPKYCYSSYLTHILSWDYRSLFTQANPSELTPSSAISDTINKLAISHLVALNTIISVDAESPDTITASLVYPAYVEACNHIGITPVKRKPGFKKLLDVLTAKKLVRTKRNGRFTEITPRINRSEYTFVQDRFCSLAERAQHPQLVNTVTRVAKNVPRVAKNLEATVGDLYIGHLAALHAIISLSKDSTDPITSSQAYPAYVVACNDIGIAPVAREPGFRKIVEALADKELIRTEREGRTIEIRPLIDSAGAAIVTDRFNNLKERAQTPPTLLSDEEIRALLPDAPAQQLTLITIHHLLRETRKSQVLMSEVYQTYSELCRKKGGTPKNERDFKQVIAALEKGGYIQVQRGRVGKKPANRIKPCEGM